MIKASRYLLFGMGICFLAAHVWLQRSQPSFWGKKMTSTYEQMPTIRLTLGDDFSTVQNQSSYRFPRTNLGRIDAIMADAPFIFEYTRPSCRFTLPPGRSFGASVDNWHITGVNVSPHLKYISQDDALQMIGSQLPALLQSSGWECTKHYISIEGVKSEFSDNRTQGDHTIRVEDWRCGDDKLYLEIERHWKKDESLPKLSTAPQDLYVVTVKLRNEKVSAAYPGR